MIFADENRMDLCLEADLIGTLRQSTAWATITRQLEIYHKQNEEIMQKNTRSQNVQAEN